MPIVKASVGPTLASTLLIIAGGWGGGFAAAGAGGYQNTEIGQVIVLAYLDAYIKMVQQLGGLPPGDY